MKYIRKFTKMKETGVLIPLLLLWIVTYLANHAFFSKINMIALFRTVSISMLGSMGETFLFACGNMDLCAGAVFGLAGMVTGFLLKIIGAPIPLAILGGLAVGAAFGIINGMIVNRFGIPAFIATLGTQYIARGLCNVITGGEAISGFPEAFDRIGGKGFFGIPWSVYIALVVVIGVGLIFKYATFGRSLLAVGGNRETARVCGLNVKRLSRTAFVIASILFALAGILSVARLGTAQAAAGGGWEMTVIGATIIGGVSMFGGSITVFGAFVGVTLMETLTVSMTMMKVDAFWQKVAVGIVIILAVGIDTYRRKSLSGGGK